MKLFSDLEQEIQRSYEDDLTPDKAEELAGKFLHAQMTLTRELRQKDLDVRMRKAGLKAVQAVVYLDEIQGKDKKPTEAALQHIINTNPNVSGEQDRYDVAEVDKTELERYYDIFANAHIFYRNVSRKSNE